MAETRLIQVSLPIYMFKIRHKTKVLIEVTLLFALKLGMMEAFGTNEKDKEVCVVYQDDDQKALLEGVDKLIVERKRDRPMWFSRAQLERVREEPSGVEGTLKPSGLV